MAPAADTLRATGVAVHLFEDDGQRQPPVSVFPNNGFSTHPGGHVAVYSMFNPSRRRERRTDVLDFQKLHYRVQDVIDYSGLEHDGLFLEGTGAMVLGHRALQPRRPAGAGALCHAFQLQANGFRHRRCAWRAD